MYLESVLRGIPRNMQEIIILTNSWVCGWNVHPTTQKHHQPIIEVPHALSACFGSRSHNQHPASNLPLDACLQSVVLPYYDPCLVLGL